MVDGKNPHSCVTTPLNEKCTPTGSSITSAMNAAAGKTAFGFSFNTTQLWEAGAPEGCDEPTNQLFVQFSCEMSPEEQYTKYQIMCGISSLGVLTAIVFAISVRYIKQAGNIKQLEWDVATLTAADYTVEFKINPNAYRVWKNSEFCAPGGPEEQGVAPAVAFKHDMKKVVEENLTKDLTESALAGEGLNALLPTMMSRGRSIKHKKMAEDVKVADIQFAFNNQKLIGELRNRGKIIST